MGLSRKEQKKLTTEKILDAAAYYFSLHGYLGAKLEDISRKAGVTNGLIVQRFGGRDELYIALFDEIVIQQFPSIRALSSIKEGLLRIIGYTKKLGTNNHLQLSFTVDALKNINSIPTICRDEFYSLFVDTDFERIYQSELRNSNLDPDKAFDYFVDYIIGIGAFTDSFVQTNSPYLLDESYIGLFNRWNRHLLPDQEEKVKIDERFDSECNIRPFFIILDNGEPQLHLTKTLIEALDVNEILSPREKYLYFINNLRPNDRSYFLKSVDYVKNNNGGDPRYLWKSDTFVSSCICLSTSFKNESGQIVINGFLADMYKNDNESSNYDGNIYNKKIFDTIDILSVQLDKEKSKIDRRLFEGQGANVTEAFSVLEGIRALKKGMHFDLIVVDDKVYRHILGLVTIFIKNQFGKGFYVPPIAILTEKTIPIFNPKLINDSFMVEVFPRPIDILEIAKLLVKSLNNYTHIIASRLLNTTKIANTDALTKVKNATAFAAKKKEIDVNIKKGQQHEFAIILCDIDDLKMINDNFGHTIGDSYIKNCSKIICETFSHSPVYRIGGDEFVIYLDRVDFAFKEVLIRRFKYKIEQARMLTYKQPGFASMSFGVALYDKDSKDGINELINKADEEMYKIKRKYKNQKKNLKKV